MENTLMKMPCSDRQVILGTDWHTDCDDAVAIRILAWAHRHRIVRLLGISIDSAMEYSVSSMKVFMENEGISDVALGLDHQAYDYGGVIPYQKRLSQMAPFPLCNDSCEDALRMYRRLLASADGKVDLIEIGFSQVLAALLESGPDEVSSKSGMDLVREKVGAFWIMGGSWDRFDVCEYNFSKTKKASRAIHTVLEKCPVEVKLLGLEIGKGVLSGAVLKNCVPKDMLYQILCDFGAENGRNSWDPMLVYLSCVGNSEQAGYREIRGRASVDPETGYNFFAEDSCGTHCYVQKLYSDREYEACLNEVLLAAYMDHFGSFSAKQTS